MAHIDRTKSQTIYYYILTNYQPIAKNNQLTII